ncbi:MAG TPA: glycosyltransferase [Candidatus Paceibacterota bacterium]|nr:glycosyltransferase [Candidatus Paceibacterota bacterium]
MQEKVLYVITKSNWGGAQQYVFDLAAGLPKERFKPVVALGGAGEAGAKAGLLAQKLEGAGIRTIFVRSFMRDISLMKEFSAFSELLHIFKNEKPDVVHLNSSKAGALGGLAARLAGVRKIIFTAHGWPFRENRSPFSRGLLWLASYATGLLATTVVCVSDFDLAQARAMPGVRAVRIYNGVGEAEFASGESVRALFPAGARITGTVGELNRNKNQIALVEAARKDPDMFVAIAGEGELRGMLEQKIKEYKLEGRVKLLGFVPYGQVMKGFDVFALPSLKEGLPYVLIQARQAGVPIEANRTGGVVEILDVKDLDEFKLEKMISKTAALY